LAVHGQGYLRFTNRTARTVVEDAARRPTAVEPTLRFGDGDAARKGHTHAHRLVANVARCRSHTHTTHIYGCTFFLIYFTLFPLRTRAHTRCLTRSLSLVRQRTTRHTHRGRVIFFVFLAMPHPVSFRTPVVSRRNVPFVVDLFAAAVVVAERLWKTITWNGSAVRHCYGRPPSPPPHPSTQRRSWTTTVRRRYVHRFGLRASHSYLLFSFANVGHGLGGQARAAPGPLCQHTWCTRPLLGARGLPSCIT